MKKYTAQDVADYLIANTPDEESGEGITHLKLQKLLYYSQGFYLAFYGKPLFEDPIEAWLHGPVVDSVYQKYKSHSKNPLPYSENFSMKNYDEEVIDILDGVLTKYGQFSGWRLRELTHEESPWRNAFNNMKRSNIISHQSLIDFFKTQISE